MIESGMGLVPLEEEDPTENGRYCGAKTRPSAKHPNCRQRAGHRTDHVGQGRCRLHGGMTPITTGRGSRNLRYKGIVRIALRDLIAEMEEDPDPLNIMSELAFARAVLIDFLNRYTEWREALLAWHADWSLEHLPISEENELAFIGFLTEFEVLTTDHGIELSPKQTEDLGKARNFVARLTQVRLRGKVKPKEVLDPSAAMAHIDTITKIAEREWKRRDANAISRTDLIRFTNQLGMSTERMVRRLIPDEVKATQALKELKQEWMTLAVNL